MEMDPNPPSFNIPMSVQPTDLGADYAKGMTAGQAVGETLGKGISGAFDVMNRNRTADDTLKAMQQTGMLSKEGFDAVAGKALGAKEAMLGMYAGQWIAQQAQNRELQKLGYQGNVDIATSHAKLLDTFALQRGKLPILPNQQPNQQVLTAPKIQPAQPLGPNLAYTAKGTPTPLGSAGITNPTLVTSPQLAAAETAKAQQQPITIGAPIGKGQAPNLPVAHVRGQAGFWDESKKTFYPLQ